MPSSSRVHLSVFEKNELRRHFQAHGNLKQVALQQWVMDRFQKRIGRSTISRIVNTPFDVGANEARKMRRPATHAEIEPELLAFAWDADFVSDDALQARANELVGGVNSVSLSWINRFKKRHGISLHDGTASVRASPVQCSAPRQLSEEQVQELAEAAAVEKLTPLQLKERFGLSCSALVIQRALAEYARSNQSDGERSGSKSENTDRYNAASTEDSVRMVDTVLTQQAPEIYEDTGGNADSITTITTVAPTAAHESIYQTRRQRSTANAVSDAVVTQTPRSIEEREPTPLLDEVAQDVAAVRTGLQNIVSTLSRSGGRHDDPRLIKILDAVKAQNELLQQQNMQLARQTSSIDTLVRHLINHGQ